MKKIMTLFSLVGCLIAGVGACTDNPLAPDEQNLMAQAGRSGAPSLDLLTWNLYVGAEIERIAAAGSIDELLIIAGETWAAVQATDFEERAASIASYIAETQPHAVALQEVSRFWLRQPGLYTGAPGEWTESHDFLAIVLEALEAHGVSYTPAAVVDNFMFEVPALLGPNPATDLADIRLQDMDVVLVRRDVIWHSPVTANYSNNASIVLGGQELEITRGFASVVIEVKEKEYRVVSTHLTPREEGEAEQVLQAEELIAWLDGVATRAFVMGDLNTAPGLTWTDSYGRFTDAGFLDLWDAAEPNDPAPTCCQDNDLLNPISKLDRRFDIVFYRDVEPRGRDGIGGRVQAVHLGAEPDEKTPSGLWPSDHAGVQIRMTAIPNEGGKD